MPVVFLTMHRRGVCLDGAPGRSGGLCPQACSLQELVQAAGLPHTSALRPHHIVRRINDHEIQLMSNVLKYLQPNDLLDGNYRYQVYEKYWPIARAESFHPEF